MQEDILQKFGVTPADYLGEGDESRVYRLSEGRMLRVYKEGKGDVEFLRMLKVLYDGLYGKFSFRMPHILELAEDSGVVYSVGELIEGRAMNTVLPTLDAEQKKKIYQNYLDAVEEFRSVALPERPYGEIIGAETTTADTWTEYLEKSTRRSAKQNEKWLSRDVEHFPLVVEKIVELAREQKPTPDKSLVHGDYFPNNILVSDELEVVGVIDMSGLTVVGDHALDAATSYVFLETTPGATAEDAEIYLPMVLARYGEGIRKAFDFYALYYAIMLGINSGHIVSTYPMLYPWVLKTLKNFQRKV